MSKFKIGDKVRIVKEFDGFNETCSPTVGEVGVVNGLFENGYVKVFFDNSNIFLFYEEECLKLVDNDTSPKYTYADVIIDPNDPRVEIGETYYFGDTPSECIASANSDRFDESAILVDIDKNEERPFAYTLNPESGALWYVCIIRKKEPSYKERQEKWIADNNIKIGDKVKITRKAKNYENGWDTEWTVPMDKTLGESGIALAFADEIGIQVETEDECFWYPYFILEKVEEPEKKYVPFDLNNEEDRAKLRGAWVRLKGLRRLEQQIVSLAINTQLVFLPDVVSVETKELLEGYEFLDGSPCGIVVEDEE